MTSARPLQLVVLAASLAALFSLSAGHSIAIDEVEFFRAARWVGEGRVPFRDFWEHHAPLQWYVLAPLARLAWGDGIGALLAMRWTQVPLWIGTFAFLLSWMKAAGRAPWARLLAVALPLTSWTFMQKAIELRVDTIGCFCIAAALWLAQRRRAYAAGVMLALAALANLRLAPVIVVIALIAPLKKRIAIGASTPLAAYAAYLVATSSAAAAWQQVIVETGAANRLLPYYPFMFARHFALLFGADVDPAAGLRRFIPANIDLGGLLVWILGIAGIVVALRRRTEERALIAPLVVAIVSIAAMRVSYTYHFEIVVVLLVPFIAIAAEAVTMQKALRGVVAAALVVFAWNNLARAQDAELAAQDATVRLVHAHTAEQDVVFDAVGWAWKRRPAWRYWFIPSMVHVLERHGMIEPLSVAQLHAAAPRAVILDYRMAILLSRREDLARYVKTCCDVYPLRAGELLPPPHVPSWHPR